MTYTTRIAEAKSEAFEDGFSAGEEHGFSLGRNEGIAIGEERGRNEGISLGITQAKLETAKSMKSENMSISLIAHFTGLSVEEIEKL